MRGLAWRPEAKVRGLQGLYAWWGCQGSPPRDRRDLGDDGTCGNLRIFMWKMLRIYIVWFQSVLLIYLSSNSLPKPQKIKLFYNCMLSIIMRLWRSGWISLFYKFIKSFFFVWRYLWRRDYKATVIIMLVHCCYCICQWFCVIIRCLKIPDCVFFYLSEI